jgi:hypothetical protein
MRSPTIPSIPWAVLMNRGTHWAASSVRHGWCSPLNRCGTTMNLGGRAPATCVGALRRCQAGGRSRARSGAPPRTLPTVGRTGRPPLPPGGRAQWGLGPPEHPYPRGVVGDLSAGRSLSPRAAGGFPRHPQAGPLAPDGRKRGRRGVAPRLGPRPGRPGAGPPGGTGHRRVALHPGKGTAQPQTALPLIIRVVHHLSNLSQFESRLKTSTTEINEHY